MFKILTSRLFLISFAIVLAIALGYPYLASGLQTNSYHKFMSLSTLDSNMTAEKYFPRGTSTISSGDNVNWTINVYNHLGNTEYLVIKIKLLNYTDQNPDDIPDSPSPVASIAEIDKVMPNNSTWIVPISWTIMDAVKAHESTSIHAIMINDVIVDNLEIQSTDGKNFRMVFELWKYDPELGQFEFAWNNGSETRSMWNQVWFNLEVNS